MAMAKQKKDGAMATTFDQQFQTFSDQVSALNRCAQDLPGSVESLLPFVAENLSIACEELNVAEEELRQQNDELVTARLTVEEQRQRYQELFEFAPDAYLVTDGLGVIRVANRAASGVFGLARTYVREKPLAAFVLPEEQRDFRSQLEVIHQRTDQSVWTFETRLRSRGHREPTDVSIRVGVERDGASIVRMLWLVRDVTEHKQAVSEVRRLNLELERRVRERTGELEATSRVYRDLLAQEQAARAEVEAVLCDKTALLNSLAAECARLLRELDQSTVAAARISALLDRVQAENAPVEETRNQRAFRMSSETTPSFAGQGASEPA